MRFLIRVPRTLVIKKAGKREDRKPGSLLEEKKGELRTTKETEDRPRQACCLELLLSVTEATPANTD